VDAVSKVPLSRFSYAAVTSAAASVAPGRSNSRRFPLRLMPSGFYRFKQTLEIIGLAGDLNSGCAPDGFLELSFVSCCDHELLRMKRRHRANHVEQVPAARKGMGTSYTTTS
jgi:hypothetical protein